MRVLQEYEKLISFFCEFPFMEIVFIGTGGGRINLIKQIRATGGFRINSKSANLHVDPGPGALVHSVEMKQNPLFLDAIVITHAHIDHFSDAMVMIEGMSSYGLRERGILIGSRQVMEGDDNKDRGVHGYHQKKAKTAHTAVYGERKKFETEKGSFEIEILPVKHEEPTAFGFKLHLDGSVLGHITDTEYVESLGRDFAGCDCLIINCMKPSADSYGGHLKSDDVINILREAKPKTCIITHFGLKMLKAGPAKEAERIEKESGVKTIAARDGMRIVI